MVEVQNAQKIFYYYHNVFKYCNNNSCLRAHNKQTVLWIDHPVDESLLDHYRKNCIDF